MKLSLSAPRSVVGLDVEPGYVAAAEVKPGAGLQVSRAAIGHLPPGAMRDGEVADVDALAAALKAFFKANDLDKRVRIGAANQRVIVRTIDLPPVEDRKQLETAVRFQAQDHIPMPLEQAVLDWQDLGPVETPDGPRRRVVVVAARRDTIERLLTAA